MKLNQIHDNPPKGVNFTAYYYDGSGAALYQWTKENQIVDAEGDYICEGHEVQDWLCDADYGWWTELPADFQFWFMNA